MSREDVNPVSVYVGNGWQDWMTMELWPLLLKFGCLLSDPARIYPGCTKPNVLQVYRISDKRKGTKKNAKFGQLRTFLPFFEGAKMPWCSCRRRWAKNCLWFLKIFPRIKTCIKRAMLQLPVILTNGVSLGDRKRLTAPKSSSTLVGKPFAVLESFSLKDQELGNII